MSAVGSDIKEVMMDVQGGGDGTTRKRGRRGRRATRRQEADEQVGGEWTATVEKVAPAPAPVQVQALIQSGGAATVAAAVKKPTVIVLAPAKKKTAKVMLVPKGKSVQRTLKRTFKAKRVHVTLDHTAKTQKRRRQLVQRIDTLTDEQLRNATVAAQLSRRESVAHTPASLLRQMLRDYQTMKGMLL
jgi:hypothetical protein